MTGRYEDTDEYNPEDWELKINTKSDESRRVWGPTQQLRTEAAAARRTSNTMTTEQVNQNLQGERDRRWTEFHNRMLAGEQQEAANTLRGEAAEALIALSQAATTTATTTRAQDRAEATPQLVIPKPQRLHSIVIKNNMLQNRPPIPIPPLPEIEEESEEELDESELTRRRRMSVEDMARDIGAIPAYKRTEVLTKTELVKERRTSPPQCRMEAEDDKFFIPSPSPPPAVLITDSPSPVNDHEYCTNCKKKRHMKIMCPFYLKKTCRKCSKWVCRKCLAKQNYFHMK